MKFLRATILILLICSCVPKQDQLEIYDFQGIERFLFLSDSKTYVINFWATWCAPCIKELPYFEQLQQEFKDQVEVILISLDFPSQFETKLKPFLEEKQLKSKVIVLDDVDMNSWIPKIDKKWDGAIPVTLIYNEYKRQFYPQSFTYEQLLTEVKKFIN
ncbi:MAG: TlpA disulfide reductase family protein [Bacteroidetes bacterium]|nr:TlpA disulfide reductase family protein [Bacteroidota bacterium]